jgi:hypothetical protein
MICAYDSEGFVGLASAGHFGLMAGSISPPDFEAAELWSSEASF